MSIFTETLPQLITLAEQAGELIMTHYKSGNEVFRKDDKSPVTIADRQADELISQRLKEIAPDILVVSEEGEKPDVSQAEFFWLVDPLDGTKSFIRGSGYFTVNIALINQDRIPVLGIIYDPVNKVSYWGSKDGAFKKENGAVVLINPQKDEVIKAFVSHSHLNQATEDYLNSQNITEKVPCASSIKFCFLAEGKADVYPRFAPTMEWDIAAGHAIILASGGKITTPEGKPFLYGKKDFLNGSFLAYARQ